MNIQRARAVQIMKGALLNIKKLPPISEDELRRIESLIAELKIRRKKKNRRAR